MLSLHTNAAGLTIRNNLASTSTALSTSMTRLGTGYKINSAADDAAGLQIATRLLAQTRGMAVASQNTQNGISLMQTAEGAFQEFTNIVLRMKDLATQAADGATTADDRTALAAEYTALTSELGNILTNTTYGGEALFAAGGKLAAALSFQIGATAAETMSVDVTTELTAITTFQGTPGALTDATTSSTAIGTLDGALKSIGAARAKLGAAQNRLTHTYNNLQNMQTNTSDARGRIMDVDYAAETANMTSKNILMQAGTSMLKQSSQTSQLVLSLLQG